MKAGRTAGHTVRTQHGVTEAQANGAATWRSATTSKSQRAAGAWSSTCPSLTTCLAQVATLHVQQNGLLSHAQDLDVPLRLAAQRKINSLRQQGADNPRHSQHLHRMHGEFLGLPFLQAHRETEAHFTATGMPSQRNQSDSFRFKRAAFYQSL